MTAIAEYEATNRGLINALGGKMAGVDACYSVERLMRLPFTVNLPNAKKRALGRIAIFAADVKHFPDRIYALADLPKAAPTVSSKNFAHVGAPDAIDVEKLAIPDDVKRLIDVGAAHGDRSEAVYRVLRVMHSAKVSPEGMLGVLTDDRYRIGERFDWQEERARGEVARVIAKAKAELEQDFRCPIDDHWLTDDTEVTPVESRGLSVKGSSAKADDSFMNALSAVRASKIDPALNLLRNTVVFRKPRWNAAYGTIFNDNLLRVVRVLLANLWQGNGYEPSEKNTFDAIMTLAFRSQFNPVLAGLTWDGVKRLDRLFVDYFPCGDDAYTRAVAPCFGIAAVRRQRDPGCKFDTIHWDHRDGESHDPEDLWVPHGARWQQLRIS
jgi:hypothetical protein